jgi:lipoate-protein ligase A
LIITIFEKFILMLCIKVPTDDPYFNLAAEEYCLHNRTEDLFLVWISKPAVIVGKHQNTLSEINSRFVGDHDILVARRLSGGGTVYHDRGNLNFSFITNEEPGRLIDFKRHALPVTGFLEHIGIQATLGTKNEILTRGMKISGNAGHVYKNRVLHHGTLLFDTDLQSLRSSLSGNPGHYSSRAVQSNRATVANIRDFLARPMNIETFSTLLLNFIREKYRGERSDLAKKETEQISQLAAEKYSQWEWIYGYSPEYRFENEFYYKDRMVKITFTVQKGFIRDFHMQTDLFPAEVCIRMTGILNGCRHGWEDLLPLAGKIKLPGIPAEKTWDFIMENFF